MRLLTYELHVGWLAFVPMKTENANGHNLYGNMQALLQTLFCLGLSHRGPGKKVFCA